MACLGADIDPAGGFVDDEDLRRSEQPLAEQDLLLVATGEVPDPDLGIGRPDVDGGDRLLDECLLRRALDPSQATHGSEVRQAEVFAHGLLQGKPWSFRLSGSIAMRAGSRRALANPAWCAVDEDVPAIVGLGAEERAGRPGTPAAHEARDANDLAGPHFEAHTVQPGAIPETSGAEHGWGELGRAILGNSCCSVLPSIAVTMDSASRPPWDPCARPDRCA